MDPELDLVVKTKSRGALFRVDPVTGAREILSAFGDGADPEFEPLDPAVEADGRVLVRTRHLLPGRPGEWCPYLALRLRERCESAGYPAPPFPAPMIPIRDCQPRAAQIAGLVNGYRRVGVALGTFANVNDCERRDDVADRISSSDIN